MAIYSGLSKSVDKIVRSGSLKSYVDKRLVSGLSEYVTYVEKLCSDTTLGNVKFSKPNLTKACSIATQSKLMDTVSKYSSTKGSKGQMKFMGYVIMTCILVQYKLQELAVIVSKSYETSENNLGITNTFYTKLEEAVDLMEDVCDNYDDYLKEVSNSDIRYLEVGLKRMLASEVDSIV